MSKSVLVMETPERGCIFCPIGQNDSNYRIRVYIVRLQKKRHLMKKQKQSLIGVH